MKDFVNYRKRSIQLPKGCKELSDVLKSSKKSQRGGESLRERISKSRCEYCGAPAVAGWASGSWSADGTKSEEAHFWCRQCQDDLKEFKSRPENCLPELPEDFDFNDSEATKALEQLMHEIGEREKAFMRQKVAERKGPQC